jgi:hypothetical protein
MTKDQAFQLGEALIAWSMGADLEARDISDADKDWYPFIPDCYEKITVKDGIEWRTAMKLHVRSQAPAEGSKLGNEVSGKNQQI